MCLVVNFSELYSSNQIKLEKICPDNGPNLEQNVSIEGQKNFGGGVHLKTGAKAKVSI